MHHVHPQHQNKHSHFVFLNSFFITSVFPCQIHSFGLNIVLLIISESMIHFILKVNINNDQVLYIFLDHTLSTTNNLKHKMVVPFIEQFKQIKSFHKNIQLNVIFY